MTTEDVRGAVKEALFNMCLATFILIGVMTIGCCIAAWLITLIFGCCC